MEIKETEEAPLIDNSWHLGQCFPSFKEKKKRRRKGKKGERGKKEEEEERSSSETEREP